MTPSQVKASYKRMLGEFETIAIRRYSGTPGARTSADKSCLGKSVAYQGHELVGTVVQGDQKVFAFVDDLNAAGLTLPVTTNDKVVVGTKELAIMAVDANTIRLRGETIAYILQARG